MSEILFNNTSIGDLSRIPVPAETHSYKPVAHVDVRNEILEQLDRKNLNVHKESYRSAVGGKRIIGYMDIEGGNDVMGFRLAFRNSYDKSMSLAFVGGNQVWICSNGLISGDIQFIRKHTGSIVDEMKINIENGIEQMYESLQLHTKHADTMSRIEVQNKAELAGRLFIEENIVNSHQMSALKEEINSPSYEEFDNNSVWSFYNAVTHSLKKSHPTEYMKKHIKTHEFFEKEFQL